MARHRKVSPDAEWRVHQRRWLGQGVGKRQRAGAEMLRRLNRWTAVRGRREEDIQDEAHGSSLRTGE